MVHKKPAMNKHFTFLSILHEIFVYLLHILFKNSPLFIIVRIEYHKKLHLFILSEVHFAVHSGPSGWLCFILFVLTRSYIAPITGVGAGKSGQQTSFFEHFPDSDINISRSPRCRWFRGVCPWWRSRASFSRTCTRCAHTPRPPAVCGKIKIQLKK